MIDWIKEFGEPSPHIPESVVPLSIRPVSLTKARMRGLEIRRDLTSVCESPIEIELGAAIILFFERAHLPLKLVPQFVWMFYRSDWAVISPGGKTLLIECDGRDFHHSPDQMAHDAAKDAAAAARGYRTIRFSGSQIHNNPKDCAKKVFDEACLL